MQIILLNSKFFTYLLHNMSYMTVKMQQIKNVENSRKGDKHTASRE